MRPEAAPITAPEKKLEDTAAAEEEPKNPALKAPPANADDVPPITPALNAPASAPTPKYPNPWAENLAPCVAQFITPPTTAPMTKCQNSPF